VRSSSIGFQSKTAEKFSPVIVARNEVIHKHSHIQCIHFICVYVDSINNEFSRFCDMVLLKVLVYRPRFSVDAVHGDTVNLAIHEIRNR